MPNNANRECIQYTNLLVFTVSGVFNHANPYDALIKYMYTISMLENNNIVNKNHSFWWLIIIIDL